MLLLTGRGLKIFYDVGMEIDDFMLCFTPSCWNLTGLGHVQCFQWPKEGLPGDNFGGEAGDG